MRRSGRRRCHQTSDWPELVCSNSPEVEPARHRSGLLKEEMRRLDSLNRAGRRPVKVPAGGRPGGRPRGRSPEAITEELTALPNVRLIREEVARSRRGPCVLATGRLPPTLSGGDRRLHRQGISSTSSTPSRRSSRADTIRPGQSVGASRYERRGRLSQLPHERGRIRPLLRELIAGPPRRRRNEFEKESPTSRAACRSRRWRGAGRETLLFGR